MAKETRRVHVSVTSNAATSLNAGTAAAGGLSTSLKGVAASATAATGGIKAMTMALISSGVGALVVGLGVLVAGLGAALSKSTQFEKALSTLEAVTGSSKTEVGELSNQAKQLGSTTAFTAVQVLSLQTELAKLGFKTDDIKNSTGSILDLAASLEVDLGEAAEFSGSLIKSFGLSTKETQRVVDVMAKSTSSSALSFSSLRESLKLVAPVSKATNVSVEKTTALLGVLADRGLKGSIAGTGLAKTFIMLNKKGISLADGMKKVRESADPLNTAIDMVGVVAGKTFLTLASGQDDIAGLEKKFLNASGAAQKMADVKLDNLAGDTTKLSSAWEGFLLSIEDGEGMLNRIARGFIQATTAIISFITPTIKLSEELDKERSALFALESQLLDTNTSEGDRIEIIEKLQKEYPDFLKNIDVEKATNEELSAAIGEVNEMLINKIILQEADEEIQEALNDAAKDKKTLLENEMQLRNAIAQNAKQHNLEQTEGTLQQQAAAQQQQLHLKRTELSFNDLEIANRRLRNGLVGTERAQDNYNESMEVTSSLTSAKNGLMEDLGMTIAENTQLTDDNTLAEGEATKKLGSLIAAQKALLAVGKAMPETTEAEIIAKNKFIESVENEIKRLNELGVAKKGGENKELNAKNAFLKKLLKLEQDSQAKTKLEAIEVKRKQYLAELELHKMSDDEKGKATLAINAIYDQKKIDQELLNKEARKKIFDDFDAKFKIKSDDPLQNLADQKAAHLLELEQLKVSTTEKEMLKASIVEYYADLSFKADQDRMIKKQEEDARVLELKKQTLSDGLDAVIMASGEESKIGQLMLKMKQAMMLAEIVMKMKALAMTMKAKATESNMEMAADGIKQQGSLQVGMANASKLGPPWNAITMATYAIQAGMMIKNMAKQKKEMQKLTSRFGGQSFGGGGGSAVQAPAFNVIGQTSNDANFLGNTISGVNNRPMRAYVVAEDVTSTQALQRNTETEASLG